MVDRQTAERDQVQNEGRDREQRGNPTRLGALIPATVGHRSDAPRVSVSAAGWLGLPPRPLAEPDFAGNARFTFPGARAGASAWLRFQGTAAIGAAISFAGVAAGVALGMHYLLAQAVATLVALVATYQINRRWSFATMPDRR